MKIKELDYGNCETVRFRGKEAYIKDVSLRTETCYKADGMGELAQHSEALSSVPEVKHEVVHRNNAPLPGEVSLPCGNGLNRPKRYCGSMSNRATEKREVSRDHSSCRRSIGSSCRSRKVRDPVTTRPRAACNEGSNRRRANDRRCL